MTDRILVSAPACCEPERRYILGVVLSGWLGLEWSLRIDDRADVTLTMVGDTAERRVTLPDVFFRGAAEDWLGPASLPRLPLALVDARATEWGSVPAGPVPVLFGTGRGDEPIGTQTAAGVDLRFDVFGSAFFLITRYEEATRRAADAHARFPDAATVAVQTGTYSVPLADLYVDLLSAALLAIWPGYRRRSTGYRVALTHDVDLPLACRQSSGSILHSAAADVLKRRDLQLATRRASILVRGCENHDRDPWNLFDFLMDVSEENGLASSFNFLANPGGPTRTAYSLDEPWIRRLLTRVHARGHEIGLHGGYNTYRDASMVRAELERLRRATAASAIVQDAWGGRQHFLRWSNPSTWRAWDEAGLDYDSTVGFAGLVGFRTGTCHEYPVYDLERRRAMRLRERPLIAMDTSWLLYRKSSPVEAARTIVDAARTCRRYGGEFVGLFHNSELASRAQQRWYRELIPAIVAAV